MGVESQPSLTQLLAEIQLLMRSPTTVTVERAYRFLQTTMRVDELGEKTQEQAKILNQVLNQWDAGNAFPALAYFFGQLRNSNVDPQQGSEERRDYYVKCFEAILSEPLFIGSIHILLQQALSQIDLMYENTDEQSEGLFLKTAILYNLITLGILPEGVYSAETQAEVVDSYQRMKSRYLVRRS